MSQCLESVYLAWRDWKFEYLLSLCAVLALASMLTPILVLQGLKNGVIEGMRSRLLEDPAVLIITPKSDAGRFSPQFVEELRNLPGARFAIGRTRDTSTDMTLFNQDKNLRVPIAFEPAASGEPVLEKYAQPLPENGAVPQIVLSASAAKALDAAKGETLEARVGRRIPGGKLESVTIKLSVAGILPPEAGDRRMAFAPQAFMEDMENYRDYIAVPERGLAGNPASLHREYSSFRLYARSLDDVERLAAFLADKKIEVITKSREIAGIRLLENAINHVIFIISLAVGGGFAAFAISSAQSAVSRKKKMLGMLRLLGFRRAALMCYPATQTMLTAFAGFILSLLIYWGVSLGIVQAFSGQGGILCNLNLGNVLLTLLIVLILSFLSCARAAWQAAAIEPSMVIREI